MPTLDLTHKELKRLAWHLKYSIHKQKKAIENLGPKDPHHSTRLWGMQQDTEMLAKVEEKLKESDENTV